jgi:protoporphyrinogen oxidase
MRRGPASTAREAAPEVGGAAPSGERWAIVGGGMLGMTLALRLGQAGRQVTLFEAADGLGGLAAAWSLGEIVWDRHYHVTLASDRTLRALLAELGLAGEMRWGETRTGFYVDGRIHSLSGLLDFFRFPSLGPLDTLRLGVTILRAAGIEDGRRLEGIPVTDWLRRWSGRRVLERVWLPLLRAKLGSSYERTSAAFIWATIKRMYAARHGQSKRETFGYVSGGYARVLARLGEVLTATGVRIRLGQRVRRVEAAGQRLGVETEGHAGETFDRVVLTVPAPMAARLCPDLSPTERARLEGVEYRGIVCASVLLAKPLTGFYVTNIADTTVPLTAVIEMSALVDPAEMGGHALVYLPKYVEPDAALFARSDQEIEAAFLDALGRICPRFDRAAVRCVRVSRVRHVFALPTLGYSDRLPPMTTSVPGLALVSSAHILNGTLNVNDTVRLAEESVARLLVPGPR